MAIIPMGNPLSRARCEYSIVRISLASPVGIGNDRYGLKDYSGFIAWSVPTSTEMPGPMDEVM